MKLENADKLADLKKQLYVTLSFLRDNDVSTYNSDLILISLLLQRDGYLMGLTKTLQTTLKQQFKDLILKFVNDKAESDIDKFIYYTYEPTITRIETNTIFKLIDSLNSIDQLILKEYFPEIFDEFLYDFFKSQGKYNGEIILPIDFSKFVCSLVDIPKNAKIYNPYAGSASFGVFFNSAIEYLGQDLGIKSYVLGNLRIIAHNRTKNSKYIYGDSVNEWNPTNEKYDLIIACPPFGLKTEPNTKNRPYRDIESDFVNTSINSLTSTGKTVAILPLRFLFSNQNLKLRLELTEKDLIEKVIYFPGGLLYSTSIPIAVLVLNKAKDIKNEVLFIDASKFTDNVSLKEKSINYRLLLNEIQNSCETEAIKIVSGEKIKSFDYDLSVSRYFLKDFEGVNFGNIVKVIPGQRISKNESGYFVHIRNLKNDALDFELDILSVEFKKLPDYVKKIDESCILIATRWNTIKPTVFNYSGMPIYISNDIIALKVTSDKVDIEYLIQELLSSQVKEQIDPYRMGEVIPFIKLQDILKIKIRLPGMEAQKVKVLSSKELHFKQKEVELKGKREKLGIKDAANRDFASIKHTLRQYLNALKSNVAGTQRFIINNEGKSISMDTIYSKNLNRTFREHLTSLEGIVDSMSKLITTVDETISSVTETKPMNLKELIIEAQNRFKNTEIFEFEELFIDKESFNKDSEYLEPTVIVNEEDFYRIYSNIISNAIDHGFKNSHKKNFIRTTLSFDPIKSFCKIEISNNGLPFPKRFSYLKLITRGEKTSDSKGSGTGGADIKELVEKYEGTFNLLNQENELFPVTYILSFPILLNMDGNGN